MAVSGLQRCFQIRAVLCRTVRQDHCILHTIMSVMFKIISVKRTHTLPIYIRPTRLPVCCPSKKTKVRRETSNTRSRGQKVTDAIRELEKHTAKKKIFFITLKTKHIYLKSKIVRTEIRLVFELRVITGN